MFSSFHSDNATDRYANICSQIFDITEVHLKIRSNKRVQFKNRLFCSPPLKQFKFFFYAKKLPKIRFLKKLLRFKLIR